MTDNEVAETIFKNAPYSWRVRDVQSTEPYARDIQHYRPRDNDWPGVDDRGASAQRRPWEYPNNFIPPIQLPAATETARARRVVGYVNWYGENNTRALDVQPRRTWEADEARVNGLTVVNILSDSVLYRSEPANMTMDSPVTRSWYTSRYIAMVYNDIHYVANTEQKEVYPFVVYKDIPLLSMNDAGNVRYIINMIAARQSAYANTPLGADLQELLIIVATSFPVDSRGVVGRVSNVPHDNAFCEFFITAFPRLAGWIYMNTPEAGQHHDEIFIHNAANYLVRDRYIVKEVRETVENTNAPPPPPPPSQNNNNNVDDDNEDDYGPLFDSDEEGIIDLVEPQRLTLNNF